MHKKDYIAIAGAIRQSHDIVSYSRLSLLTDKLVVIFKADNPLFDSKKFYDAAKEVPR